MPLAMVTAAAGMIGEAVSRRLIEAGWQVVMTDKNPDNLEAIAALVGKAPKVTTHPLDVTDLQQVKEVVARILKDHGRIDGLVNIAGGSTAIGVPKVEFTDSTPAEWDIVISVNFKGMLNCTHTVLPHMIENGEGVIVNTASGSGIRGGPPHMHQWGASSYRMIKGSVIALTQSLAQEVGPHGIRVNCYAPGNTASRWKSQEMIFEDAMKKEKAAPGGGRMSPLGRLLTNRDLANSVAFLMSDRASHVTGTCIDMTGGIRLW
jgi:3-oxoacyl-[acyl-carrier protein] reductase